jgi:hypothetical protein
MDGVHEQAVGLAVMREDGGPAGRVVELLGRLSDRHRNHAPSIAPRRRPGYPPLAIEL